MKKPVLLIPVENQVRELDAKLLLACVAARRELVSIIGSKRKIEIIPLRILTVALVIRRDLRRGSAGRMLGKTELLIMLEL